jgi:two-component system, OmpR family, phosphate regulon sensor histidine kinase PhoR
MNIPGRPGPNVSAAGSVPAALVGALGDCAIVVDQARRIIAANAPADKIFARDYGRLEDRRLSEAIRDIGLHDAFAAALDRGISCDVRLERAGANGRTFDVRVAPFEVEGMTAAIGVFSDVTRVERLERTRQEFLSNISHELRTPLTSILAFIETLEDGAIDDPRHSRRFLSIIRRNAERMHSLIADILELALIESGKVSVQSSEVALSPVVEDIFAALSSQAGEREIRLVNSVSADIKIAADPARLEQMLTNLIDNAVKFNRRGGSVNVAFRRDPGWNVVTVSDTGEGILPDHLPRIFERFYRSDRSRSREIGGTGLGLAIVKHLARLHGGTVSVSSTLGEGTRFSIELPAVPPV